MFEAIKCLWEVCKQSTKNFICGFLPCFQHYQKAMLSTYPFQKLHCLFETMLPKKKAFEEKFIFWKVIDKVGRILTSPKFCFISFLAFLCKAVTSINFKEEGKLADLIAPFMLVNKSSANYFVNNSSRNIGFLQSFSFI